ncbi:MAG: hypothetical protein Q8Q04_01340 [archaeon]|nr:hypothetical protein [archaeon]
MTNKVSNLVKILTGRKLSEKKMELARDGTPKNYWDSDVEFGVDRPFYNIYIDEGNFKENKVNFEIRESPDASHGTRIMHTNLVPVKEIEKTFNKDGLLEEKYVWKDPIYDPYKSVSKTIFYNPAGSFFGKKA